MTQASASTKPEDQEKPDTYAQSQQELLATLKPEASLTDLQDYVRRMVISRGFEDETPQQVMLMIAEEVGELAKALRKTAGIKIDATNTNILNADKHTIGDEMADVLLYLFALANILDINLASALHHKEEKNTKRRWV